MPKDCAQTGVRRLPYRPDLLVLLAAWGSEPVHPIKQYATGTISSWRRFLDCLSSPLRLCRNKIMLGIPHDVNQWTMSGGKIILDATPSCVHHSRKIYKRRDSSVASDIQFQTLYTKCDKLVPARDRTTRQLVYSKPRGRLQLAPVHTVTANHVIEAWAHTVCGDSRTVHSTHEYARGEARRLYSVNGPALQTAQHVRTW